MSIYNRNCTYQGHEKYDATHICISKDCRQQKKWCCIECTNKQGIHNHIAEDQPHIIPWQDIMKQKKEEVIQFQQDQQKKYLRSWNQLIAKELKQCEQIYKFLQEYQLFIQLQMQNIDNDKLTLEKIISDLSEEVFIKLDDQRITEILYFDKNKFINNQKSLINPLTFIDMKISQLETSIKDYKDYCSKISSSYVDIKLINYQIKQIHQTNAVYNASQISNNEQYLAFGNDEGFLKIYEIKSNKVIKDIQVETSINICQFTFDSSQLYVGTLKGYVHGYDVINNFKQIFRQQIHQDQVCNIRTIQNQYLITCSSDRAIIKTDLKSKQQIFKYIVHAEFINAIDYDDLNDTIISGSHDKSIKIWDCKKQQIIISKQQTHPKYLRQIQLINNYQNLLSLDSDNNLYKWRIDLMKKDLQKIQEFRDPNKIYNFYQINQDKNLLLICDQYIKILDEQGQTINIINHQAGEFNSWIMESKQLDNGRYIHIRSKQKIMLARALN